MRCPFCGEAETRVLDSRSARDAKAVRRRRQCTACANRFSTMEKMEEDPLLVVKRGGRRELFDSAKILRGLLLAGQKRNIPLATWEEVVESLEQELRSSYLREVSTDQIGDIIMARLKQIDEVAYVRFASVFRHFPDVEAFKAELETMLEEKKKVNHPATGLDLPE